MHRLCVLMIVLGLLTIGTTVAVGLYLHISATATAH